mmetsp:Transcript_88368/g.255011  ORF Transcript_88368/g.255011 Transcript_88368/m.255011 type:complete len:224 (-) Transcript_88368:103-774(-)
MRRSFLCLLVFVFTPSSAASFFGFSHLGFVESRGPPACGVVDVVTASVAMPPSATTAGLRDMPATSAGGGVLDAGWLGAAPGSFRFRPRPPLSPAGAEAAAAMAPPGASMAVLPSAIAACFPLAFAASDKAGVRGNDGNLDAGWLGAATRSFRFRVRPPLSPVGMDVAAAVAPPEASASAASSTTKKPFLASCCKSATMARLARPGACIARKSSKLWAALYRS